MTDRMWLVGVTLSLLSLTTFGCASPYTYSCGDRCGTISLSGRYTDGDSCAECGSDCGGECDGQAFAPTFEEATLTSHIVRGFGCQSGCGDMYWGEWSYDPPDACDPCNNHGDWTGELGCCKPSGWTRFWSGLHGQRAGYGCQTSCGQCDECMARDSGTGQMFTEPLESFDVAMPLEHSETILETRSPDQQPRMANRMRARHPYSRLKQRTER